MGCAPVKLIYVYRNGDPFHEGDTFFVKHAIKSLDVLYKFISQRIKPPGGQVHELYDQNFVKVKSLSELKNEGRSAASPRSRTSSTTSPARRPGASGGLASCPVTSSLDEEDR